MKSWSIWKRRRATRTRPCSSCLASGEVGTRAGAGKAGPKGQKGLLQGQQCQEEKAALLRLRVPSCLCSLSPCRLIGMASGIQPGCGLSSGSVWKGVPALPVCVCALPRVCCAAGDASRTAAAAEITVKSQTGPRWAWGAKNITLLFGAQPAAATVKDVVWQRPFPCSQQQPLHSFPPSTAPQGLFVPSRGPAGVAPPWRVCPRGAASSGLESAGWQWVAGGEPG